MTSTQRKLIVGTAIILFLLATSAWADGRGRGGREHYKGGHSYKQGYPKKHFGHQHKYRGNGHRHRHHYRHHDRHYYRHHYRHGKPHHRHYKPRYYRSPAYRTGFYFSIYDPYFSLGFSTGRH